MCTSVDYFLHDYLAITGQTFSEDSVSMCYSGDTSRRGSVASSQRSSISSLELSRSLQSLVDKTNKNNNSIIKRIKNYFSIKLKPNDINLEEKILNEKDNVSPSSLSSADNIVVSLNIDNVTNNDTDTTTIKRKKRDDDSLTEQSSKCKHDETTELYDYEFLLKRAFNKLEIDRPELLRQRQQRIVLPCAQLLIGQTRTIISNWMAYHKLCKLVNRDIKYFQQYLEEIYECQSSVNKNQQLILNVRTNTQQMNRTLNKFLNEYVLCKSCRSANTHLLNKNRLFVVECQLCGSQTTVKKLKWKNTNQKENYD